MPCRRLFLGSMLIPMLMGPVGGHAQSQLGATPPAAAGKPGVKGAPAALVPAKPVPVVKPPKAATATRPAHRPPAKPAAPLPASLAPTEPAPIPAPAPAEPGKGSVTGLPMPRFAALRTDDVNLRAGPGTRYSIDWVYHRRDLPVQIEREYDRWRLVSDMDGVKGWVHQATLAGRRTFITKVDDLNMRRSADGAADTVAVLKLGVVGRILSCAASADWCEVSAGDRRGFLKRDTFWGTYPGEAVSN